MILSSPTYTVFIFCLIFSPVMFATTDRWAVTLMEAAIASGILLASLALFSKKQRWYYPPGLLPLLLLLGLTLFQLLPLPHFLLQALSPATFELYSDTILLLHPQSWLPLSVNSQATLDEFFRLSSYVLFYVLTIQLLADRKRLRKTVYVIICLATGLALISILQKYTTPHLAYGFRQMPKLLATMGPWQNYNHFAGFMEMIFPVTLALFYFFSPQVHYQYTFKEKLNSLFNSHTSNRHLLLGFAAFIIGLSIFLSLSRGGIISFFLSLIFFALLINARFKKSRKSGALFVTFILIVLGVTWIGWDPIMARFARLGWEMHATTNRLAVWQDSMHIIRDFPLFGSGMNTFGNIYQAYCTSPTPGIFYQRAHNDYIELLTDGGLAVFLLVICFLAAVVYSSFKTFRTRRDPYLLYLYIGSLTGIFSLLLHSFTDFNLHIYSNGLYFFLLLGLLVASANTNLHERRQPSRLKAARPITAWMLTGFATIVLLGSLAFNLGTLTATYYTNKNYDFMANRETIEDAAPNKAKNAIDKALLFAPLHGNQFYMSSLYAESTDTKQGLLNKAILRDPSNGIFLQEAGRFYAEQGDDELGEKLISVGAKYGISRPRRLHYYGAWLLERGRKDDAAEQIRQAIFLDSRNLEKYITTFQTYEYSWQDASYAIPHKNDAYYHFARILEKQNEMILAEDYYLKGLEPIDGQETIKPYYFNTVYWFLIKQKKEEKALAIVLQGIKQFPDNIDFRLLAADRYKKMDFQFLATKLYKEILNIDPDNQKAQKRLAAIKHP
ncbi:MAG: O-antigen ligase family protein [Desulfobulbaceae bacterium]|uniref:O-antigen ligase family protein n=1 Tax=Candidatus Desulfobia pelagia TaxID=2841692 RepID=A0A8J6NF95_9BACT|nr:O-antigen ligase family protein [Candidatus Desulfobia pelagia]